MFTAQTEQWLMKEAHSIHPATAQRQAFTAWDALQHSQAQWRAITQVQAAINSRLRDCNGTKHLTRAAA